MNSQMILNRIVLAIVVILSTSLNSQAETNPVSSCDTVEFKLPFLDDFLSDEDNLEESKRPERIETDRHDFTQTTETVGQSVAQIEAGYTYFYDEEDGETEQSHTAPELMLRLGLTENIEFRARWNHVWRIGGDGESEIGSEDLRLALKLRVTDQSCWIPESALELFCGDQIINIMHGANHRR